MTDAPTPQEGLLDALAGFEGRWSAQVNDLIGGWVVTDYPHPLSAHEEPGPGKVHVIAECTTEHDAKYVALLLNAHEAAVMVPGEVDHMLRLALVGQRTEQYHMDAEFHAFVHLLAGILPRLVAEYAAGDRPRVERRLKDFLAGIIQ